MNLDTSTIENKRHILFYDGECGLCHRCVAWFLRHDRRSTITYAPLQGETYAGLSAAVPTDLSTMVFLDDHRIWTESGAVLAALRSLGGAWGLVGSVGRFVPPLVRDGMYRFVARRRIGWFGPADACVLPGDGARFLP